MIRSSGEEARSSSARIAQSCSRCSQLSRMTRLLLSARYSLTDSSGDREDFSSIPRASVRVCAISSESPRGASSTSHTPSEKARCTSVATRVASRVFPTPPTPVRVTSRDLDNSDLTSATSCRRPTKLVTSAGSLRIRRRLEVLAAIPLTSASRRPRVPGQPVRHTSRHKSGYARADLEPTSPAHRSSQVNAKLWCADVQAAGHAQGQKTRRKPDTGCLISLAASPA